MKSPHLQQILWAWNEHTEICKQNRLRTQKQCNLLKISKSLQEVLTLSEYKNKVSLTSKFQNNLGYQNAMGIPSMDSASFTLVSTAYPKHSHYHACLGLENMELNH